MANEQVDDISTEREWVDELFAELFKPACFVCKYCKRIFPTLDQVNAHMDKERHRFPKPKGPYYACVCQFCNDAISGPIELKRHIQEKEFKNLFPKEYREVIAKQLDFPCVWCESRFKREEHCSRHELKECPDRPAHFQQEDDVQEVNDPANEDIQQLDFLCPWCSTRFKHEEHCYQHEVKECPLRLLVHSQQEDSVQEVNDPANENILQENVENVRMNNYSFDPPVAEDYNPMDENVNLYFK